MNRNWNRVLFSILSLVGIVLLTGCAIFQMVSQEYALKGCWRAVVKDDQSKPSVFGYITLATSEFPAFKLFIEQKGLPDYLFILPTKQGDGSKNIKLLYVKTEAVYNWSLAYGGEKLESKGDLSSLSSEELESLPEVQKIVTNRKLAAAEQARKDREDREARRLAIAEQPRKDREALEAKQRVAAEQARKTEDAARQAILALPDVAPLAGYGKVQWGDSAEQVTQHSWGKQFDVDGNGITRSLDAANLTYCGLISLGKEDATEDGERQCVYCFCDDKLAIAIYYPPEKLRDNGKDILAGLTKKYGQLTQFPANISDAQKGQMKMMKQMSYNATGMSIEGSLVNYETHNPTGGVIAVCTVMKLGKVTEAFRQQAAAGGDSDETINKNVERITGQRPNSERISISSIVYYSVAMQEHMARRLKEAKQRDEAAAQKAAEEKKKKASEGL